MGYESSENISFIIAFFAGLGYFLSPCVLPLIPSYISYITGVSFEDLTQSKQGSKMVRIRSFFHSVSFVLGFSAVFILLGFSASALGVLLSDYLRMIQIGGGVLIIFFGLFIMQLIKIPFLMNTYKMNLKKKPAGYIGSFFMGIAFCAGWTACSTPLLSAILVYTSTAKTMFTGGLLLGAFSLGLGIPFILSAVAINSFLGFFQGVKRHFRVIEIISGIVLIVFGVLIVTDSLTFITGMLYRLIHPY